MFAVFKNNYYKTQNVALLGIRWAKSNEKSQIVCFLTKLTFNCEKFVSAFGAKKVRKFSFGACGFLGLCKLMQLAH